jgi:hypothetical protein
LKQGFYVVQLNYIDHWRIHAIISLSLFCVKQLLVIAVRYWCNQNPYIEEEQTTQWPKEKVQKDKQRSKKHIYKTKDRVTQTPLKTVGELFNNGLLFHFLMNYFYYCGNPHVNIINGRHGDMCLTSYYIISTPYIPPWDLMDGRCFKKRVRIVEQEQLLAFNSTPFCSRVRVTQSLAFFVLLCRQLFISVSFFFWPLYCLSVFALWLIYC